MFTNEFKAVKFVIHRTFNRFVSKLNGLIVSCCCMIRQTLKSNFLFRHQLTSTDKRDFHQINSSSNESFLSCDVYIPFIHGRVVDSQTTENRKCFKY